MNYLFFNARDDSNMLFGGSLVGFFGITDSLKFYCLKTFYLFIYLYRFIRLSNKPVKVICNAPLEVGLLTIALEI